MREGKIVIESQQKTNKFVQRFLDLLAIYHFFLGHVDSMDLPSFHLSAFFHTLQYVLLGMLLMPLKHLDPLGTYPEAHET